METYHVTQKMIELNRSLFNNNWKGLAILQGYSTNIMHGFLQHIPGMTDEQKKPFNDSLQILNQTAEYYKNAVDQSFASLERMFDKQ